MRESKRVCERVYMSVCGRERVRVSELVCVRARERAGDGASKRPFLILETLCNTPQHAATHCNTP